MTRTIAYNWGLVRGGLPCFIEAFLQESAVVNFMNRSEEISHFINLRNYEWHKVLSAGRTVLIPSPREITSKYYRMDAERVVSLLKHHKQIYGAAFFKDTVSVVSP